MKKMIIIYLSLILTACIIQRSKHGIENLELNYISMEYIGHGSFEAILKSNKDLRDLYKLHKLLVTYETFECNITPDNLGKFRNDDKNKLNGIVEFVKKSDGFFVYSVKLLAFNEHHLISTQEYIDSISTKTDKLYCQYEAIFYQAKEHFKSKIFEVDLKDFLKPKGK